MSESTGNRQRFLTEVFELVTTAWRSWRMLSRPHRFALLSAVVLMTVGGVTATAIPLLSGRLVDRVATGLRNGESRSAILISVACVLAGVGGLVLTRELLQVIRRYLVENACTRIERHMSVRVVSRLLLTDLSGLTHEKVGALHGKIFRSIGGYMRLLKLSFLDFFPAVIVGLFAIGTAVWKEPWLGLAMLGVIPISLSLTVWQLVSQKRVRLRLLRVNEEMDGTIVELLGGLDYVRVANAHAREQERVEVAAEHKRSEELRHHVAMSFFGAGKAITEGLFHVGVLALAAYLAVIGQISFGDILTFSMLFLGAMAPLNEIHRVLDEGHECSLRVNDLQDLLALPVDASFMVPPDQPEAGRGDAPVIRVEGLRAEYRLPDGRSQPAIDDLHLKIYPGETIGVAGKSGGGKSTWLKVLMRLLHPADGHVWMNGVHLSDLSRETISRWVGYVGQNPFVFSGTIEENIVYGATGEVTPADVERAARMACIHDEIMMMPGGYQTRIAERGSNLSGGQRQRLALARVFLRDPSILVLDEATSALDAISERRVQEAIGTARRDRTIIMVAHRLSTLVDADRIFVFDNGRLVEAGTYLDLLARDGLFTELVRASEMSPESRVASREESPV